MRSVYINSITEISICHIIYHITNIFIEYLLYCTIFFPYCTHHRIQNKLCHHIENPYPTLTDSQQIKLNNLLHSGAITNNNVSTFSEYTDEFEFANSSVEYIIPIDIKQNLKKCCCNVSHSCFKMNFSEKQKVLLTHIKRKVLW